MTSVGIKRSTRVSVVNGGEGARVLRSGRRLWPVSDGGGWLCRAAANCGEWLDIIPGSKSGASVPNRKYNGCRRPLLKNLKVTPMVFDAELHSPEPLSVRLGADRSLGKIWGSVYQRKRKRKSDGLGNLVKDRYSDDSLCGKYYMRRQRRRLTEKGVLVEQSRPVLAAVADSSRRETFRFARFVCSVFGYMTRARVRSRELSAFLIGDIVKDFFSSHGIHFSQVPPTSGSGICKFFGVVDFVPLFSVDFSVSSCFSYMHLNMLLRSQCLPSTGMESKADTDTDNDEDNYEDLSCIILDKNVFGSKNLTSGIGHVLRKTKPAPKLALRSAQRRNGINSFSFCTKRRSLRSTRARNYSLLSFGKHAEDIFRRTNSGSSLSSVVSDCRLRSSVRKSTLKNIKEVKSALVGTREGVIGSMCCYANLLICELDSCYREGRVNILLEFSSLRQWAIAVKRDGSLRYLHVAQAVMQPCTCNHFTHAIIWTGEDGWKLEFPNQGDWFIFKELYKECYSRNMQAPTAKIIPVPGVREVSGYDDGSYASFVLPDSYVVLNDDEVSRAMAKRTANYDIDSEDEEWLDKLNNDLLAENEFHKHVSVESFELVVDAFEKAHFCNPDEYSDGKAAIDLCLHLGRTEVVEAVKQYWMRKRKQNCSALVRIFQCHQPRVAQPIPKSILRRRRSSKRQPPKAGRGKQRILLQAFAAEHDVLKRAEEAKSSANRCMELAVHKRRRAQILMENADLLVYKATMALRIVAEGTRNAGSTMDSKGSPV